MHALLRVRTTVIIKRFNKPEMTSPTRCILSTHLKIHCKSSGINEMLTKKPLAAYGYIYKCSLLQFSPPAL